MAAKARGMLFLEVKESHKESEDVIAMCFLGFADCWKKIDVATWRASCERNTLKGLDK